MKLNLKKKLVAQTGKVKSVDFHPTFNWILLGLYNGSLSIYDYNTQASIQYIEVTIYPIRSAKFMSEKNLIICGADDKLIRVYNYNTMEKVHEFEAHTDFIRSIVVHYKEPLFVSCSDDGTINLYNVSKNYELVRTYSEHSDFVMRLAVNPKDYNMFASGSMDNTIKIWSFNAPNSQMTLEGHKKGIGALAFCPLNDKPYLASGSDDCSIRIWDYTNKQCIYTLKGHENNISALCFHSELPILISAAEDFTCKFWNINTSKIEDSKIFGYDVVWDISATYNDNIIALGCDEATLVFQLGNEEPLITFSNTQSKIIYSQQNNIYSINLKQIQHDYKDGEIISISPKELGSAEVYPNKISYSPNGKYFSIISNKDFIISTSGVYRSSCVGNCYSLAWNSNDTFVTKEGNQVKIYKDLKEEKKFKPNYSFYSVFGGPFIAIKTDDSINFYDIDNFIFIRKIEVVPNKVIWNEKKNLVALITDDATFILKVDIEKIDNYIDNISEGNEKENEDGCDAFEVNYDINEQIITGFFIDDIFIYQTIKNKINYSVNDKNFNITTLSSNYFLLGYLPLSNHLYLMNKNYQLISYLLPMSLLNYQIAILEQNFDKAQQIIPTVPEQFLDKIINFLEKFNYNELSYSITKNPNQKFSLALKLKKLEDAWNLAQIDKNSEKFKMVADLALELGELKFAEKAMREGNDFAGLLLYYSSIQDINKIKELGELAKSKGIFNIAYTCFYQINDLNSCLQLLLDSKRFPEAAIFCRTYCPSQLSSVLEQWNILLNQQNENNRIDFKIINPIQDDHLELIQQIENLNNKFYTQLHNTNMDDENLSSFANYFNLDLLGAIKQGKLNEIEDLFK